MKKLVFIVCILVYPEIIPAQINIGLKGGVNVSSINYDKKLSQQNIEKDIFIGYLGGITFQYFSQKNMGIQIETLYIQKGFKTQFNPNLNTQYERSIDYVSLPFLMHAYFGDNNLSISLILGPFGSYALQSSETLTEGEVVIKQPYSFDPEFDNRFDFGLQGGLGIKNKFNFGTLEIEGMFAHSFINLYKWGVSNKDPEKDKYFEIPEVANNQGYQLSISYYYTF